VILPPRLLNFCDNLNIDFFSIVVDPNSISAKAKERKDLDTVSEYAIIMNDIATMMREQAIFRDEVRRDIARLNKKIDLFIDAHYEELTDLDEVKHTAVMARQAAKEIQSRASKQFENEEIVSLSVG